MKSKKQKTLMLKKYVIVDLSLISKLQGGAGENDIGQSLKTKIKRLCKSGKNYCNTGHTANTCP